MLAVFRVRCSVCLLFVFRERWAGLGMWAWGALAVPVVYLGVRVILLIISNAYTHPQAAGISHNGSWVGDHEK